MYYITNSNKNYHAVFIKKKTLVCCSRGFVFKCQNNIVPSDTKERISKEINHHIILSYNDILRPYTYFISNINHSISRLLISNYILSNFLSPLLILDIYTSNLYYKLIIYHGKQSMSSLNYIDANFVKHLKASK